MRTADGGDTGAAGDDLGEVVIVNDHGEPFAFAAKPATSTVSMIRSLEDSLAHWCSIESCDAFSSMGRRSTNERVAAKPSTSTVTMVRSLEDSLAHVGQLGAGEKGSQVDAVGAHLRRAEDGGDERAAVAGEHAHGHVGTDAPGPQLAGDRVGFWPPLPSIHWCTMVRPTGRRLSMRRRTNERTAPYLWFARFARSPVPLVHHHVGERVAPDGGRETPASDGPTAPWP